MENQRRGETGPIPKRHQRLFRKGGYWYVATREAPIGPFADFREALAVSRSYLKYLREAPSLEEALRNS